jgi:hypothetical protein
MEETPYFEILTPLRVLIRTTPSYWNNIVTQKHPILANQEELAKLTLKEPSEIRSSFSDPNVFLYYRSDPPYYLCIVVRHLNGEGFIITAYRTHRIKRGQLVWTP